MSTPQISTATVSIQETFALSLTDRAAAKVRDFSAKMPEAAGKPLITTECWSLVDYKDFPLLNWNWLMELCDLGVRYASSKGRWAAIATSNFCGLATTTKVLIPIRS